MTYANNSSNQLLSTPLATFTYDQNGNILSKNNSYGLATYAWDYENRLTSATTQNGVITFKYDPFGRRIQKSSASGTTIYVYDGANAVEELDGAGVVTARFVQGAGIDEPLAQSRSGLNFYHADGLGSVTSMTDGAGLPSATYVYGAFGTLASSSGTVANPYRYTAREYDPETGLYYYRARYYDPTIGRFLSEDLMPFSETMNLYSYVINSPTNYIDPAGLIHQAWKEAPFDGRLHDDPGAGLEILCTKGRNRASDLKMLEHSILVRSLEIGMLLQNGEKPDAGHSLRLGLEIATWKCCKDECDKDKKPEPETNPFEVPKEWQRWLENRWEELDYHVRHNPPPCWWCLGPLPGQKPQTSN